jgi:hypothetical protein
MQGIASQTGEKNENKLALAEIERAEAANVKPEEAVRFRKAVLAKASLFVGEGPESKLSTADFEELSRAEMEYAKQKGVSQAEMGSFIGGLLAQQKGKTTADEMKTRAGKVFATLEASSAEVSHLLPGVTRAMAQGLTAQESASKIAMLPEIAPEEESTHLLGAIAQVREARMEGKLEQFGVTDEMAPNQMMDKVVTELDKQAGTGKGRGKRMDELLSQITEYHIAQDTLRGLANQGPAGLARWRNLIEQTPADQIDRAIRENRDTAYGRHFAADARLAAERARMGEPNDAVARWRQETEAELAVGGHFDHVPFAERLASFIPFTGDLKTQQISRQAIRRARSVLGEQDTYGDIVASGSQAATDKLLRELLVRVEQIVGIMKEAQRPAEAIAGGALVAVMPRPRDRM